MHIAPLYPFPCPALQSNVTDQSHNTTPGPESAVEDLLSWLTPTAIDKAGEVAYQSHGDSSSAANQAWTLMEGIAGLSAASSNVAILSQIAVISHAKFPDEVDSEDVNFIEARASIIADDLMLISKLSEKSSLAESACKLRALTVVRMYAEVYGRVYAIAEQPGCNPLRAAIDSL